MSKIQAVTLPKWGLEMAEGTIGAWRIPQGAAGAKGAELVDIETEKIVNTLDLDSAGMSRSQVRHCRSARLSRSWPSPTSAKRRSISLSPPSSR